VNEKAFEWSLLALSIICLLWIILGSVFGILNIPSVIIIGLVVWIAGGVALLYFWGRNYISKM
jgi:5-bromo-4-chloroindolyl phosphate hydrolysis protein